VCEAAYSLMGKRLTASLSPLVISSAAAAGALVMFVPLAAWDAAGFDWSRPSAGQWAAAVWWGAGTMGLGSWLWFQGMRRVQPGTAAAFMGVMPVSALVLSYLLLGEAFSWLHLVGMALVLVGLVAVVRAGATVH
jgi:drug/metabolite transporter (DMT)-like permease